MQLAKQLESQGRGGDTMLAHINPEEARLLEAHGGAGTINPVTGLAEFDWWDDLWDGVRNVVKEAAPYIIPAVAIFAPEFIPLIGTSLGASAALAPAIGAAALSAGVTLVSGGNLKDALTSAALAGTTTFLAPIATGAIQSATGLSASTSSLLSSAAMSGGVAALRGDNLKQVLAAAATGAATSYLTNLAHDAFVKINTSNQAGAKIQQKGADDSVFVAGDAANLKAAGFTQQQIANTLRASGVNSMAADVAAAEVYKGSDPATVANQVALTAPKGAYGTADGNTKALSLGNNVNVLQSSADQMLLATDAAQLHGQGLTATEISENLQASGADKSAADYAARAAVAGKTTASIANELNSNYGTKILYTNTDAVVDRGLGQVMSDTQEMAFRAIPYKSMIDAGQLTIEDAAVLAANKFTPADTKNLIGLGYTGSDLQDLASVGVTPSTLTGLANTKFAETQINDMMHAGASANDIAQASAVVNTGKISVDTAQKLLYKDLTGSQITSLGNNSKINVDNIANSDLNSATIGKLLNGGYDLNRAAAAQAAGADINGLAEKNDFKAITSAMITPVAPTTTAADTGPLPVKFTTGTAAGDAMQLAQDANQLRAQGLNPAQIKAGLIAAGADPYAAGIASTYAGADVKNIVSEIQGRPTGNIYKTAPTAVVTPAPVTPVPAPVTPPPTEIAVTTTPITNMIPALDAQGNTVYFDPATNNVVSADGKILIAGNSSSTEPLAPGQPVETAGGEPYRVEVGGIPRDARTTTPLPQGVTLPEGTAPAQPEEYADYKWSESAQRYIAPTGAYYDNASNTWVMPIANRPTAVTQDMLDKANQSDDPIAALNDQLGWTPPVVIPPSTGTGSTVGTSVGPVQAPGEAGRGTTTPAVTTPVSTVGTGTGTGSTVGTGMGPVQAPGEAGRGTSTTPVLPPLGPSIPIAPAPVTGLDLTTQPPVVPPVVQPPVDATEIPHHDVPPPDDTVVTPPVDTPIPYVPPTPVTPPKSTWKPADFTPLKFGQYPDLPTPGLNPGWVQPTPYYNTTNAVQSQYYWGPHPYQPGPTFNQALYNTVPAPAVPFGLREMYQPTDINTYLARLNAVPGPVAPR